VSQYFVPDEGGDGQSLFCVDVPVMSVNGVTLARCAGLRRHSFRLVLGIAIDDGRVLTVLCQRACDGGIDGAAAAGVASDISGEGPDDQTPRLDEFQHIGHRTGWLLWPVVWKLGPDAQQHDWHFVLG
jgi:hypothetical protein